MDVHREHRLGSTVSVAQRTQSQSAGGEVVISDALRRLPGMDETLRRNQTEATAFTARLRGIDGKATLHRLVRRDGAAPTR